MSKPVVYLVGVLSGVIIAAIAMIAARAISVIPDLSAGKRNPATVVIMADDSVAVLHSGMAADSVRMLLGKPKNQIHFWFLGLDYDTWLYDDPFTSVCFFNNRLHAVRQISSMPCVGDDWASSDFKEISCVTIAATDNSAR